MSLGIKFRRNNKVNLMNAQEGEVVYAIDTDEWGLGIDGDILWREHLPLAFTNHSLSGTSAPDNSEGEIGDYFLDTLNEVIYQRQQSGWEEIVYAYDNTLISGYIESGTIPGFDDTSTILLSDGSVLLPDGWEPTDPKEPIDKWAVDLAGSNLPMRTDGSTQMGGDYAPTVADGVITLGSMMATETSFKPVTSVPAIGALWNDNGIPKVGKLINRVWESHKFLASDGAASDRFGDSIAMNSTKIAIGATSVLDPRNGNPNSGAVYVYNHDGSGETKILTRDGDWSFYFGKAVAMNETNIFVVDQNEIYTYGLDGTGETHFGSANTNIFSLGFAINSSKMVVSSESTASNRGSAFLFNYNGSGEIELIGSDSVAGDLFGTGVDITDSKVAIGAPSANTTGKVYLYDTNGANEIIISPPDNVGNSINFGWDVALSTDKVYVGAPMESSSASQRGAVYIFDLNGNFLNKVAPEAVSQSRLGHRIVVSDNYFVSSAYSVETQYDHIYAFDLDGNFQFSTNASDTVYSDFLGYSLAVYGNKFTAGAMYDDDTALDAGSVFLFEVE